MALATPRPRPPAPDPAPGTIRPSAATGQIRRFFTVELVHAEVTATRIREMVTGAGRVAVDGELDTEAADLVAAYSALKTFILALNPSAVVPDLPE